MVNFVEIHTNHFSVNVISMKTVPCENVSSDICGQWRTRSAFASAKFDQGFCYLVIQSLDIIKCINEELAHVLDESESVHFAHAQRHLFALRKQAYSNTPKILRQNKWKFSDKKFWYFSYFYSKHRLWVLVRTASMRRFKRVPTIYVFKQK